MTTLPEESVMRTLIILLLLALPTLAQSPLKLGDVIVTVGSGQQTATLRCDARGMVGLKEGQRWRLLGTLSPEGELAASPGIRSLSLGQDNQFESGGDFTPIRLDERAVVSTEQVEVFQVRSGVFTQMLPTEQALGRAISGVRIEGEPGTDRLAAYLIVVYLLLL